MENFFSSLVALLLAGWISCGREQAVATLPPEEPEATLPIGEEPYAVAEIELFRISFHSFRRSIKYVCEQGSPFLCVDRVQRMFLAMRIHFGCRTV
ncbi:MAG: hypothetical protein LBG28_09255 [Tannerella sp.]|nr:hypothetical protein [Tannerella sp.]